MEFYSPGGISELVRVSFLVWSKYFIQEMAWWGGRDIPWPYCLTPPPRPWRLLSEPLRPAHSSGLTPWACRERNWNQRGNKAGLQTSWFPVQCACIKLWPSVSHSGLWGLLSQFGTSLFIVLHFPFKSDTSWVDMTLYLYYLFIWLIFIFPINILFIF